MIYMSCEYADMHYYYSKVDDNSLQVFKLNEDAFVRPNRTTA